MRLKGFFAMADEPIKTQITALVNAGLVEQRAFVAGLTEAQRTQVGTPERWSAKDIIGHMAFGNTDLVYVLQTYARGETPEPFDMSPDEVNRKTFEERRDWPWPKISVAADESFAALLALLATFSEDDLTTRDHFPKPYNRPL